MKDYLVLIAFLLVVSASLYAASLIKREVYPTSQAATLDSRRISRDSSSISYVRIPKLFLCYPSNTNSSFSYLQIEISLQFDKPNKAMTQRKLDKILDSYISSLYGKIPVDENGYVAVEKLRGLVFLATQNALGSEAESLEAVLFNSIKQWTSNKNS